MLLSSTTAKKIKKCPLQQAAPFDIFGFDDSELPLLMTIEEIARSGIKYLLLSHPSSSALHEVPSFQL